METKQVREVPRNIHPKENFISQTYTYGIIDTRGTQFNDFLDFEEEKIKYSIDNVKIYYEEINDKKIISGIQAFYKMKGSNELFSPGLRRGNKEPIGFDEFKLDNGEIIIGFHIFHDGNQYINRIGFRTNKKNEIKWFGDEGGNDMEVGLEDKGVVVMAFYGCLLDSRIGALGVYYIKNKEYLRFVFGDIKGYFLLREHIKQLSEMNNDWEKKEKTLKLDDTNKYVLRTCKLPISMFSSIIKYCM